MVLDSAKITRNTMRKKELEKELLKIEIRCQS